MDDSLLLGGDANTGAGNTFIREVLNAIDASGQRRSKTDATQLKQALFNQVTFENTEFLFFENELVYRYYEN